jgi:hypothetical protein
MCEGSLKTIAVSPDDQTIFIGEETGRMHFLRLEEAIKRENA